MDRIILPSGRTISPTAGTVGICDKGVVTEGDDGYLQADDGSPSCEWDAADRAALANIMIERWKRFRDGEFVTDGTIDLSQPSGACVTVEVDSLTWGKQYLKFESPDEQLHASFTPNNGIRIQVSNDDLEGMAVFDLEAVQAVLLAEALLRWAKVEVGEAIRLAATANVSLVLSASPDWIPWSGGECPVADGAVVDALLDNGHILAQRRAGSLFWEAGKVFGQQIVAYRAPAK